MFIDNSRIDLFICRIFSVILIFILASTLIISKIFIYASLTPLFLYLFGISALMVFSGYVLVIFRKPVDTISAPLFCIILWALYILFHGLLNHNFNLFHAYLLFNVVLLIALIYLFKTYKNISQVLFTAVIVLTIIECLMCFAQYLKILNSLNSYFPVTGSWENPNVIAMFLTMALPAAYYLAESSKNLARKTVIVSIFIILFTLILLQCRTAIIGASLELAIILNYKFKLLEKLRTKSKSSIIAITLVITIIITPLSFQFYHAKQASADGRKLIWKVSAQMILNKPITGYGYGTFEQQYNLAQAGYFISGKGSDTELRDAGFVKMAYNELLQNGVEGGLVGTLLLIVLFCSLLLVPVFGKKPCNVEVLQDMNGSQYVIAYSGVTAFIVMSVFNFSLQAIPAMCLFVIYAAILAGYPFLKNYALKKNLRFKGDKVYIIPTMGAVIILLGLWSGFQVTRLAYDNYLNKSAQKEAHAGNYNNAIAVMNSIGNTLNSYESYWTNYGNILFASQDYVNALIKFNQAKTLTSDPMLYIKVARCYEKMQNYSAAEQDLRVAQYIEPNHMMPRFALMNLYLKMGDTAKTLTQAQDIVNLVPKISSRETRYYQYAARNLMNQLGHPYNQILNVGSPLSKTTYSHQNNL